MIAFATQTATAQYLGLNLRGDTGMKSASQAGPGYYVILPLYYRAGYDTYKGPQGNDFPLSINTTVNVFIPAVAVTTKWKVLGANYGFQIAPTILNQRLNVAEDRIQQDTGYGAGDMFVQPLSLGWHKPRADFLAGYGFYAPTGTDDGTLDMWAHEIIAGTTVYFDEARTWHAAATMYYDIHQRKRGQDIKVGDFLTLEGGVGRGFLKGAANVGMAYVMQWKTRDDSGSDIPALLPRGKNKAYGLGPEINMPVFAKGTFVALVGFRYLWEFGNSTNFQGDDLAFTLTLAKINP